MIVVSDTTPLISLFLHHICCIVKTDANGHLLLRQNPCVERELILLSRPSLGGWTGWAVGDTTASDHGEESFLFGLYVTVHTVGMPVEELWMVEVFWIVPFLVSFFGRVLRLVKYGLDFIGIMVLKI